MIRSIVVAAALVLTGAVDSADHGANREHFSTTEIAVTV